uniref:UDP-N-acetylglucosamine transferase subunit ALG14 n=1 Tax=Labrus bergylta TaxID=56723 RepID=A0A3Q3G6I3_9LABR
MPLLISCAPCTEAIAQKMTFKKYFGFSPFSSTAPECCFLRGSRKSRFVSLLRNVLIPLFNCVLFQVLCNGPGTCVPLCVAGLLLGILGMKKVLIVYVESVCRVETLSLTGKIIYCISDYFFVQWPSLRNIYPKSIFLGRIV